MSTNHFDSTGTVSLDSIITPISAICFKISLRIETLNSVLYLGIRWKQNRKVLVKNELNYNNTLRFQLFCCKLIRIKNNPVNL